MMALPPPYFVELKSGFWAKLIYPDDANTTDAELGVSLHFGQSAGFSWAVASGRGTGWKMSLGKVVPGCRFHNPRQRMLTVKLFLVDINEVKFVFSFV